MKITCEYLFLYDSSCIIKKVYCAEREVISSVSFQRVVSAA